MFDLLLSDNALPLLFHCTAGKDRTGFAAALILSALGVAEETLMDDYLATNLLWRGDSELAATLPPDVAKTLLTVQTTFLKAAFAAIDDLDGSIDAYLQNRIGLTPSRRDALRERLLA